MNASDATALQPIKQATEECLAAFERHRQVAESAWIVARQADFRLWIASTRANQHANRSLDTKLQLAAQQDAQQTIVTLLTRLRAVLETAVVQCPSSGVQSESVQSNSDAESDTDSSSDLDDAAVASLFGPEAVIDRIVDQLSRIAAIIRRAGNGSRLRVADKRFKSSEHNELRDHLTLILSQQVARAKRVETRQSLEQGHAGNSSGSESKSQGADGALTSSSIEFVYAEQDMTQTLSDIQNRLIEVNLRRRNRFIQARRQSRPVLTKRDISKPYQVAVSSQASPSPAPTANIMTMVDLPKVVPIPQDFTSDKQSMTMSQISDLPPITAVVKAPRLAPTQITVTANKVSFPYPPRSHTHARTFQCPACCHILDVSISRSRDSWKKHIIADVMPYSCILDGCDKPYDTFLSREEWESHLLGNHAARSRWKCPVCDERHDAESAFTAHLSHAHVDSVMPSTVDLMITTCRESSIELDMCPFCRLPVTNDVRTQELLDHIAEEMHEFALRSLPVTADTSRIQYQTTRHLADLFHSGSETAGLYGTQLMPLTFDNLSRHQESIPGRQHGYNRQERHVLNSAVDAPDTSLPDEWYTQHAYFEESDIEDESETRTRSSKSDQFSAFDEIVIATIPTEQSVGRRPLRALFRDAGQLIFQSLQNTPLPYAVVSHTWGSAEDEVSYNDIQNNTYYDKPGLRKIMICLDQAAAHGLDCIWIDSCCIDRQNAEEVAESLPSIFSWFANSEACFVYMADVTDLSTFSMSRWFTRGWTLQELIAPNIVVFLSVEGRVIGSKDSLRDEVEAITTIDVSRSFKSFSLAERCQWLRGRVTTLREDSVYCIVGLLEVEMEFTYHQELDQIVERLLLLVSQRHGAVETQSLAQALRWSGVSELELNDRALTESRAMSEASLTDPSEIIEMSVQSTDFAPSLDDTIRSLYKYAQHEHVSDHGVSNRNFFFRWLESDVRHLRWLSGEDHKLLYIQGVTDTGETSLKRYAPRPAHSSHLHIDYLFQAESSGLQNDGTDMYRSLIYQLLTQVDRKHAEMMLGTSSLRWIGRWLLPSLDALFRLLIRRAPMPVRCYVDAIDLCDLTEANQVLDRLCQASLALETLSVCLSSRSHAGNALERRFEAPTRSYLVFRDAGSDHKDTALRSDPEEHKITSALERELHDALPYIENRDAQQVEARNLFLIEEAVGDTFFVGRNIESISAVTIVVTLGASDEHGRDALMQAAADYSIGIDDLKRIAAHIDMNCGTDEQTIETPAPRETSRQDSDGNTALMIALQNQIDPNIISYFISICDVNHSNRKGQTALMIAINMGHESCIIRELLLGGAHVDARDIEGETALIKACLSRNRIIEELECAVVLLVHGANPNAGDRYGMTCLEHAYSIGHLLLIEQLLDYGAVNVMRNKSRRDYVRSREVDRHRRMLLSPQWTTEITLWYNWELLGSSGSEITPVGSQRFWKVEGQIATRWFTVRRQIDNFLTSRGIGQLTALFCYMCEYMQQRTEIDRAPVIVVVDQNEKRRLEIKCLIKAICLPAYGLDNGFLIRAMADCPCEKFSR